MSRMVDVGHLPSLNAKLHRARCQLSTAKPSFDVSRSSENCDSVKKARPIATPYPPPTSAPLSFQTSNECTYPAS